MRKPVLTKAGYKYKPPPPPERKVAFLCPDCGVAVLEWSSCWWMPKRVVCLDCRVNYEGQIGHHDCAGFNPDMDPAA